MVAPAVGDISMKTHLMTMPFIKHTHHTAALKCVLNSKFSVTIPRAQRLSEMNQSSSLTKSLLVSGPALG